MATGTYDLLNGAFASWLSSVPLVYFLRVHRYNLLTHIGYTSTFGDRKQRKDAGCSDVLKVRSNYPEESFQHKCCSAYPYSPCAETFESRPTFFLEMSRKAFQQNACAAATRAQGW